MTTAPGPCLSGCTARSCDNGSAPGSVGSAHRRLTHRLDLTERQAAMKATRTCTVEGCERRTLARGYCATHYSRWRKTGTTDASQRLSPAERLWSRVVKMPSGCWEFTGFRNAARGGYGRLKGYGRETLSAHRLAWTLTRGPIPDGMLVRHRCDNPPCCNPEHLELGTAAENSADMGARGRRLTGERNPSGRLTVAQADEIRALSMEGRTLRGVADTYGVSRSRICQIRKGV